MLAARQPGGDNQGEKRPAEHLPGFARFADCHHLDLHHTSPEPDLFDNKAVVALETAGRPYLALAVDPIEVTEEVRFEIGGRRQPVGADLYPDGPAARRP